MSHVLTVRIIVEPVRCPQLDQLIMQQGGSALTTKPGVIDPNANILDRLTEVEDRLQEERSSWQRKWEAYQNAQDQQANLVSRLQSKVRTSSFLI
jgi:hypothetical protein